MAAPPKITKGRRLNVVARAELGHPRTCDQCDETKDVSNVTFSPTNKGKRGWATTCRVCQGVAAAAAGGARPAAVGVSPGVTADVQELIDDMYLLGFSGQEPGRLEEICNDLRERVRTLPKRESFALFVRILRPLVAGWMNPGAIHEDIIDGLLSDHLRCLIVATRYSAKSTLTSMYVTWEVERNPLIKVMVVSRGAKLAGRMLRTVRHVFIANCPMLLHLKPTDDCLDNAEQFQVPASLKVTTGGATVTSLGVTSNLPGFRSDITIGDDVEGPKDNTPEKIVDLEETLNELHMINPKGRKIMLGTYQSEFSIYARLGDLTQAGGTNVWELHRAQMFVEEEDPDTGKKTYRSRWPGMFTDQQALDLRHSVTERAWRLHIMLICDPAMLNERPLKIGDLILYEHNPKSLDFPLTMRNGGSKVEGVQTWGAPKGDVWHGPGFVDERRSPYAQTVVAVDPASGLAGRDAIGVAVLSVTPGGLGVIRHLEGVRGVSKLLNMRRVAQIVADFAATQLVVEERADGFFGETLEGELVMQGHPMTVEKITTGVAKKGVRIIEALGPPMGAGRLVMLDCVARSDHGGEFVNQLVRVSYDGRTGAAKDHDDIVDALAHAVATCKSSLISDISENVSSHQLEMADNLRGLPLKYGGLGGDGEDHPQTRRAATGSGYDGSMSMCERLLEEDEVLVGMSTRRDNLQLVVGQDLRAGRAAEQRMVKQIQKLTNEINKLKELQVL